MFMIPYSLPMYSCLDAWWFSIVCSDLVLKQHSKNITQLPVFEKVVLNTTSKNYVLDRKHLGNSLLALELLTGQKVHVTSARKSVAAFKIRAKQSLGCQVTLRRKALTRFLLTFGTVVFPRVRDFSGLQPASQDTQGNFSLGFRDLLLFPALENHFEIFQNLGGMNITFCLKKRGKTHSSLVWSAYSLPQRN